MSVTKNFVVPIQSPVLRGCYAEIGMTVVDEAEAPVVVEWITPTGERVQYRALNGILFGRQHGNGPGLTMQDFRPLEHATWQEVVERTNDFRRRQNFPFPKENIGSGGFLPTWIADPTPFPDLMRSIELARREAGACVIIGEDVWEPTSGPVLSIEQDASPARKVWVRLRPPVETPSRSHRPWNCLSAFEEDLLVGSLSTQFQNIGREGGTVHVLSEDGWSIDQAKAPHDDWMLAESMHLVRSMASNLPKRLASAELVAGMLALRATDDAQERGGMIEAGLEVVEALLDPSAEIRGTALFYLGALRATLVALQLHDRGFANELQGFSIGR